MAADRHIIHRLVLEIEVPDRAMADPATDRIVHLLHHDLLPELEKYLDALDVAGHLLIDNLTVDVGRVPTDQLESFTEKLIDALPAAMESSGIEPAATGAQGAVQQLLSRPDKAFRTFCYFLETGRLAWHTHPQEDWLHDESVWLGLLNPVLATTSNRITLQNLLYRSDAAVHRLLSQFTPWFASRIIERLKNKPEGYLQLTIQKLFINNRIHKHIQQADPRSDTTYPPFEKTFLLLVLFDRQPEKAAPLMLASIDIPDAEEPTVATLLRHLKAPEETEGKSPPPDGLTDPDGLAIDHAGLVILHPFLQYFFTDFGLVTETDFVDEPARQLAVHLLHYLATGRTEPAEYELTFEKFLCSWPDAQPMERFIAIPQRMCEEADNLLKAVIGYWPALKSTSPDGLREGFLIRSGKLVTSETPAVVHVERNTVDILLGALPWGLGVIKLPWISEPFYVDWP